MANGRDRNEPTIPYINTNKKPDINTDMKPDIKATNQAEELTDSLSSDPQLIEVNNDPPESEQSLEQFYKTLIDNPPDPHLKSEEQLQETMKPSLSVKDSSSDLDSLYPEMALRKRLAKEVAKNDILRNSPDAKEQDILDYSEKHWVKYMRKYDSSALQKILREDDKDDQLLRHYQKKSLLARLHSD
jgi:hypothetical protein